MYNHPPESGAKLNKMKIEHLNWLQTNKACNPSIQWIEEKNIQSLEEAWNACERGDWLLWMATKLKVNKRKLVLCAALCAHTVVQRMQDARSRDAVRVAFLWGRGKATDEQLSSARKAAWAATGGSGAAAAAARAADADDADGAARAAALATAWAAADGAADKNRLRTAEIARKVLTEEVMKKIKEIK